MPGQEQVHLNYMKWHDGLNSEKPYQLVSEDLPSLYGVPRQNFEIEASPQPVTIQDLRESHSSDFDTAFDLDTKGFTFVRHSFPEIDFRNEEDVENRYKPIIEQLLKRHIPGADEVRFFQWRLRENRRSATTEKLGNIHVSTELLVPAHFVHLDQTLKTAIDYAEENATETSTQWLLQSGRLRILNIWKPLNNPVYDCPLAVCDGSTIQRSDLIVCDNITKAKVGELILPLYDANAKWYYLSSQTPDEVTIMKIVDSDESVAASCCPHTAFDATVFDPASPPRRSIELRALVYTKPKPELLRGLSTGQVQRAVDGMEKLMSVQADSAADVVEQGKLLMEAQMGASRIIVV